MMFQFGLVFKRILFSKHLARHRKLFNVVGQKRTCILLIGLATVPLVPTSLNEKELGDLDKVLISHSSSNALGNKTIEISSNRQESTLQESKFNVGVTEEEVKELISKETGKERLKTMLFEKVDGAPHPFLKDVIFIMEFSTIAAFCMGYFIGGSLARDRYIARNVDTKFLTKFLALRGFNDVGALGGIRHGLRLGFKFFSLIGPFMMIGQCLAVYRNKSSVLNQVAAGVVTCSFLKMNLGIRGMIGGGVIGAVLGLVSGCAMFALLRMANLTIEERHYLEVYEKLSQKRYLEAMQLSSLSSVAEQQPSAENHSATVAEATM